MNTEIKHDPWAPIVAASTRKEDEREKLIRYRAGYRALITLITLQAIAGFFVAVLLGDWEIPAVDAGIMLGLAGGLGYLIYSALRWPALRPAVQEQRVRLTKNRAGRKLMWIWMLVADLFAIGMFFIINFYGSEMPVLESLAWATGLVVVMSLVISGPIMKRASRRELEEAEQ